MCVYRQYNNVISEFNFIEFIHLLVPFSLLLLLLILTLHRPTHKFTKYTHGTFKGNIAEQHQQNDN